MLGAISVAHLMNDMIQSILLAIYPMLKEGFSLSFSQIGLITLVYQLAASLLQPFIGLYTDRHPKPYSLPVGMGFTLAGLLLLSVAPSFGWLLVAAVLVGTGSSVFHPESSRVARMASAAATAWRNRCSRLVATSARRWGRCWRRCSSFRTGSAAWPGSRWRRCSASWC